MSQMPFLYETSSVSLQAKGLKDLSKTLNGMVILKALCNESGPGCSKLTTLFLNISLNFQKLISQTCQYFLLKKCEKRLQCKSFSHFFNKKFQCIWL